jgi:hypothetical protein
MLLSGESLSIATLTCSAGHTGKFMSHACAAHSVECKYCALPCPLVLFPSVQHILGVHGAGSKLLGYVVVPVLVMHLLNVQLQSLHMVNSNQATSQSLNEEIGCSGQFFLLLLSAHALKAGC